MTNPEPSSIDLTESLSFPFDSTDPKFAPIVSKLTEPDKIKLIYLFRNGLQMNQLDGLLNDHLERIQNFATLDQGKLLPPQLEPVLAETFDSKRIIVLLNFDEYFKLVSTEIWDSEVYGNEADIDTMSLKLKDAAPYNIFFNALKHSPKTKEQLYSIAYTDLLCPSLGKLKESLHITYMVKILWLLSNYATRKLHKLPMTILHGYADFPWPKDTTMQELYPNIKSHYVPVTTKDGLGNHHSNLSIFFYKDESLRVVVGTANLLGADWDLYNNQVWVSPKCCPLPNDSSKTKGESPTGFKASLLHYLKTYKKPINIQVWLDRVTACDFTEIKVVLVFNTPSSHHLSPNCCMVHTVGYTLGNHCSIPAPQSEHDCWRIVAQSASLGLLGIVGPKLWLTSYLLKALSSNQNNNYNPAEGTAPSVKFNIVFPTMENCFKGYLGHYSGICGQYEKCLKEQQRWTEQYMCQWKAEATLRSRAMPYSKCYFRISPDWDKMAFYLITTSNLSGSGWGRPKRDSGRTYIRSYEVGILFLPKFFKEKYFMPCTNNANLKAFPMMFDLPLTPYSSEDEPYCWEDMAVKVGLPLPPPKRHEARERRGFGRSPRSSYGVVQGWGQE
ncbi:probable tyrosyl-DNA phosphodiesterase [Euwallacea fornicatus]|uniref:probable tyrosyl-DNA phosphodiesterase n=1 Tax=Euwallacea fornicatus TaxID=995702 RepID=UPI00338D8641